MAERGERPDGGGGRGACAVWGYPLLERAGKQCSNAEGRRAEVKDAP